MSAETSALIRELQTTATEDCRSPEFAIAIQKAVAAALSDAPRLARQDESLRSVGPEMQRNASTQQILTRLAETGDNVRIFL